MEGIVGFEMEIEQLEGKFKLGQERPEADRASIVKNLRTRKKERPIEELTASFYERQKL
jgi:predicted FMN-binding regulatory protein PaiB